MATHTQRIISLCTGIGGLDVGVGLALPDSRIVCYVEREAYAVVHLVKAMEAGVMDSAPVWDDLATFDGNPWRGKVDWIIGGIPCQPHSVAGPKLGADDDRDLWPDATRVIRAVRPHAVFIENVAGILRYYWDRIRPDLQAMGYRTTEGLFTAEEVGAPHRRERLFILAYAARGLLNIGHGGMAGDVLRSGERREGERDAGAPGGQMEFMADADGQVGRVSESRQSRDERIQNDTGRIGRVVGGASGNGRGTPAGQPTDDVRSHAGGTGPAVDVPDAAGPRCEHGGGGQSPISETGGFREDVPDALGAGLEGLGRGRQGESIAAVQRLFPPKPDNLDAWAFLLQGLPSIEPAFCRESDGRPDWMDIISERRQRLQALGNGVVPLVAAHALRTLATRAINGTEG